MFRGQELNKFHKIINIQILLNVIRCVTRKMIYCVCIIQGFIMEVVGIRERNEACGIEGKKFWKDQRTRQIPRKPILSLSEKQPIALDF